MRRCLRIEPRLGPPSCLADSQTYNCQGLGESSLCHRSVLDLVTKATKILTESQFKYFYFEENYKQNIFLRKLFIQNYIGLSDQVLSVNFWCVSNHICWSTHSVFDVNLNSSVSLCNLVITSVKLNILFYMKNLLTFD